jgi:very-short-patch-repair endonuclease
MDPVQALVALGGAARASQLRRLVTRRLIAAAVRQGQISQEGKTYRLVETDEALVMARSLHGVRSHRSAARHHGFALPPGPDGTDVLIPTGSKRKKVPEDARLHWGAITDGERADGVTSAVKTVVHCLRDLTLRDALSVGDSALRSGTVEHHELAQAVKALAGPRSAVARSRFAHLDARAANAFESSCRALLIEAGLTGFRPQLGVRYRGTFVGLVDLADPALRIAIECDGFATHGERAAMVADCRRHTRLTAAGWRSLRFTWEQVMFEPDWVTTCVLDTVEQVGRTRMTTQRVA